MAETPRTYFQELSKSELWFGLLPEMLNIEERWLVTHGSVLYGALSDDRQPYLAASISLWEQALWASSNGSAHFAAHVLRSILERVAFLWATSAAVGMSPNTIICAYESDDRKLRRQTTDAVIEVACRNDAELGILYNKMLSRYYSHLSHLDGVSIDKNCKYSKKFARGAQLLPLLLLFDVGNCLIRVIEHLLREQELQTKPFTGGRSGHEFSAEEYIRAATHVMCEKHSRKNAVSLALLINGIQGIQGQVGLTDIYRGGMEVYRYGDPSHKPEAKKIAELAIFAVGRGDERRIVAERKEDTSKGERYEVRWPKEWDVTYAAIGMVARHPIKKFQLFDYVTEFVKWMDQNQT
jgi:hypothetical protein